MRALAHPLRLAILDAMRNEGELTATRAAELLHQSPGNMSWHLQTLAKYGFIVQADGAKGRSTALEDRARHEQLQPERGNT